MKLPFVPFDSKKAEKVSRPFYGFSEMVLPLFPSLKENLIQAEIPIMPKKYLSITLWSTIYMFLLTFATILAVGLIAYIDIDETISLAVSSSILVSFMTFFYLPSYPTLIVTRKMRKLENELLFALRHLQVEIKSGIPLFNAMAGVANAQYGEVSLEFKKAVSEVSGGKSEEQALEGMIVRNPSLFFRRSIWQIANAVKSGSDLGQALSSTVRSLGEEQKLKIRKYGQELNPWTMFYMIGAVIIPSLGITFMLFLISFSGLPMPTFMFYLIPICLFMFQAFFLQFIGSRRPEI